MFRKIVVFVLLAFLFTAQAEAKVLPQSQKAITKAGVIGKVTSISVSPKLRSDRRSLVVHFANLQNSSAVSYLLTYQTSTQDEGAMGALTLSGSSSQTQELLFGTCSKNVCRYHAGIKNMKLEVTYTLKTGKKYLKRYKIRV